MPFQADIDASEAPAPVEAVPAKNPLTEEFGKFAKEQLEQWKVPGVSLAIIDGQDIFAEGYGFATLPDDSVTPATPGKPATPETVWYAASTTKAQLGAVISHLIDKKEYPELSKGWSTTISSLIRDDFVLQEEWATAHLTLEDAICHRTGYGAYNNPSIREIDGKQATLKDIVRTFRNFPSWHEPRTNFLYCNMMYVALSHAVETLTGKPLEETLHEIIWDPLEMKSTYLTVEGAEKSGNFTSHYYYDEKASKYVSVPPLTLLEVSGAGAAMTTALDWAKWVRCLINQEKPFSETVHKDIQQSRIIAMPPSPVGDFALYGVGWARTLYKGHVMYKHSGGVHAGGSHVIWFPDHKFGGVAFGNTANTSNAAENVLLYRLIDDKLGIPESERVDVTSMFKAAIDGQAAEPPNPAKHVYKDLPDTPLPPTFTTEELVGTYSDPAWGKLAFTEQPDPKKPEEKVLVATRPEMTWKWRVTVSHATGDHWFAVLDTTLNPTMEKEYVPARFNRGLDGKVGDLTIDWVSPQTGELQNRGVFKRVD